MGVQWYSHITQTLLNYFDETDIRIRQAKYTLDAQMLNVYAQSMEMSNLRVTRETNGRYLTTCPLNVDNKGVYYAFQVPSNVALATDANGNLLPTVNVAGSVGSGWIPISPLVDTLPIPYSIEIDTSVSPVIMDNPVLFDITGDGSPQTVSFTMPLPNKLLFWLDELGGSNVAVDARITGEVYPQTVWVNEDSPHSEQVKLTDAGPVESSLLWQSVDSIIIHGLPVGARLRGYALPFGLDGVPDLARPYAHHYWREITFPRFWTTNGLLLQENYVRNRFAGMEYAFSYLMDTPPSSVAVEPNTNGMFVTSGTTLYYADRREPLPDALPVTGISAEPLYSLDGGYAVDYPGNLRYLYIYTHAGSRAHQLTQFRYLLTDPLSTTYVLDPGGFLIQYKSSAGWRGGLVPPPVHIPLNLNGTYLITLEMMDQSNTITRDYMPYLNASFNPLATLDLSTVVPTVQGIAFDSHQRLWVWTGSVAVPLLIHYEAYVFDPTTRTIYLTDPHNQIKVY